MFDPIVAMACLLTGVIKGYIAIVVLYLLWIIAHLLYTKIRERRARKDD